MIQCLLSGLTAVAHYFCAELVRAKHSFFTILHTILCSRGFGKINFAVSRMSATLKSRVSTLSHNKLFVNTVAS